MTPDNASKRETALAAALIETLQMPAIIVDGSGVIMAANRVAQGQLGTIRLGEALTLSLRAPEILDSVARVQAGGAAESVTWRPRVPVERVFEVSVAAIGTESFEKHVVITLRDLTEAHRVERMRVDFVANVSHELRTPLASVLGFIETLQGPARDDAKVRDRFLEIMRDQGRRMARLIDDLLSLSRIEQNEHLRPQAAVDLVDVVHHVRDALRPMAEAARSRFDLQLPEHLVIPGDRDELVRLAENLVENAIKYGERDGAEGLVTVTLEKNAGLAVLRVKDSGPGIAPEHLPRLTERFYRVDAGASRAKGGTGLGLALVKHIVARHRGRLSIESRPGEGATFSVTLPLAGPSGSAD
jgi:two-component system phosphate regulon sensor histidine kinase PhoR